MQYYLVDLMHSAGIIHGDLHSQNVVLNNEDDIKFIDFYYACSIDKIDIDFFREFWGEPEMKSITDVLEGEKRMYIY